MNRFNNKSCLCSGEFILMPDGGGLIGDGHDSIEGGGLDASVLFFRHGSVVKHQ